MTRITSTAFLLAGTSIWALPTLAAAEETLEEVVITGSRIITNGDSSPTPVTVIATEDVLRIQPGSLADALNVLPVFSGSRGSGSNPTATGSVAAGNASANQLNLRNVGANRTLILMDGRRVPPTLINGIVDVDVIPQMLVERVDTVTGGVSAVYGSDAISGVVNYIIDKDFEGLKTHVNGGISERSDAEKYNVGVAFGTSLFGGRGHFIGSYEYREEKGILYRTDRDWMRQAGVTGAGTAQNPYQLNRDLRQNQYPFGGLIRTNGTFLSNTFGEDGTLTPLVRGQTTGTGAVDIGGGGGYYDSSLLQPSKGHQLYGRFNYEFSDNLKGYVEVSGNYKTNEAFAEYLQYDLNFSNANPFLSAAYRAGGATPLPTQFRMTGFLKTAPRFDAEAESDQRIYSTGLNGSFGDYNWGVDFVHGVTELSTTLRHNVNAQKLAWATDVVSVGGVPTCRVATGANPIDASCQPLNLFGPSSASAEAIDYVLEPTFYDGETVMSDVSGFLSGSPFSTWAGPVGIALSAEAREVSFEATSTGEPTDRVDCSLGISFNNYCTAVTGGGVNPSPLWVQSFATQPKVDQTVLEAALEFDVPVVTDVLSLNAAARYTDYDTSGDYWTWKAGLDWQIVDSLRFRATRSRDIRAPSLTELFAPDNFVFVNPADRLVDTDPGPGVTNPTPRVQSIDQSNPDLTAEIGNTVTLGFVWKPMAKLSIALDGYRIVVSEAITTVNGSTEVYQRECYASGGTSPYCALQQRPNGFTDTSAANTVTAWYNRSINLSEIETYGADLEVNWNSTLFDRPFAVRLLTAYQPHILYKQPGVVTVDQGGAAFGPLGAAAAPRVRVTGLVRFQPMDNFTVDIMERYRSHMKLGGDPSQVWVSNHLDSFATTNLNFNYQFDMGGSPVDLFLNVQNAFDAEPPFGGYSGNGTRAGLRDGYAVGDSPIGRFYTVGVSFKL